MTVPDTHTPCHSSPPPNRRKTHQSASVQSIYDILVPHNPSKLGYSSPNYKYHKHIHVVNGSTPYISPGECERLSAPHTTVSTKKKLPSRATQALRRLYTVQCSAVTYSSAGHQPIWNLLQYRNTPYANNHDTAKLVSAPRHRSSSHGRGG